MVVLNTVISVVTTLFLFIYVVIVKKIVEQILVGMRKLGFTFVILQPQVKCELFG